MDTLGNAFKAIQSAGWANQSDGNVEAPTGFFYIVDMTSERAMLSVVLEDADMDSDVILAELKASWFTVQEDSQGFAHYNAVDSEKIATDWFAVMVDEFAKWDTDEG